jgi:hypothetical protein
MSALVINLRTTQALSLTILPGVLFAERKVPGAAESHKKRL